MDEKTRDELRTTVNNLIDTDSFNQEECEAIAYVCRHACERNIADLSEQVLKARIMQDATGGEIQ